MAATFAMSGATSPASSSQNTTITSANPRQETSPTPPWTRQFKQFGLLLSGAGFLAASVAVARRSVLRRQIAALPKFYTSNRTPIKMDYSDRSQLAAQALGLATLNVMSFGVMLLGGLSWGFDISSVEELQARTRAATRRPGLVSPEDEAEMEKMMADLMGRLGMPKPATPEGGEENEQRKDE